MIFVDIKKQLHSAKGNIDLDVVMHIQQGEFIALMGESGSGKTTFLRILAGLQKAKGSIKVGEEVWQSDRFFLPPQQRKIGFVSQNLALFENMTIKKNLLYANKDEELANYLLETIELYSLKDRYPQSLSGGQRQRVALARALMRKPKILLLDEPLSALDETMRHKLQSEIKKLHKEFNITTIMVTHDKIEAYKLASRVIYLENGFIKELSSKEIFSHSANILSFTAELLEIKKIDILKIGVFVVDGKLLEIPLYGEYKDLSIGDKVQLSTKSFSFI